MSNKPSTEITDEMINEFSQNTGIWTSLSGLPYVIHQWEKWKAQNSHASSDEGKIDNLGEERWFLRVGEASSNEPQGFLSIYDEDLDGRSTSGTYRWFLTRDAAVKYWNKLVCAVPIPEPKKPLFTTEDGRPAYKGDVVYLLCFESWSLTQVAAAHSPLVGHEKEYKYFSTEKSAIEFIVMNRAVFSLKDIMNELVSETTGRSTLLWKEKNKLTQLAKSKINNTGGGKK